MQMHKMIKKILKTRWFGENSPLKSKVTFGNPTLCVVTGPNMSGKSLLRKILHAHYDVAKDKPLYMHLSLAGRTQGSFGRCMVYGSEDEDSTGYNSSRTLLGAFRTASNSEKPVVIAFDEPEIGCSEELQLALGARMAQECGIEKIQAMYVFTHSRHIVKELLVHNPTHWRLDDDGLTLDQWVSREVRRPDQTLEQLQELGKTRWQEIQKLLKHK